LAQFLIFCLVFLTLDPAAKFDVCSFIRTGDNRGVPKFKSGSRDLGHATFWPNSSFFVWYFFLSIRLQNLTSVASSEPEIIRGVTKFKSRSRDLGHAPFWPNSSFFVWYSLLSIRLQNLMSVASSQLEIIGGSKNSKVGHVT